MSRRSKSKRARLRVLASTKFASEPERQRVIELLNQKPVEKMIFPWGTAESVAREVSKLRKEGSR